MRVAYISLGKLFVKNEGSDFKPVESTFAQEVINRALQRQQKNEWKNSGNGSLISGSRLWNTRDISPVTMKANIGSVTRGDTENTILYSLETDRVGGLFLYDLNESSEKRLFHKEAFRIGYINRHAKNKKLVTSVYKADISNIATINQDAPDLVEVTEGSSMDEAPSWVPDAGDKIVYQSSGIGRTEAGLAVDSAPYVIELVDLDKGEIRTLAQDSNYDLMLPKMDEAGALYFIRVPYGKRFRKYSIIDGLKDAVLLPYRLFRTFLHMADAYSKWFSGKAMLNNKLNTAGGPETESPDLKTVFIRGRQVEIKNEAKNSREKDYHATVPSDWELIKQDAAGNTKVLAKSVAAYDLTSKGELVYSNGTAIYLIKDDGHQEKIGKGKFIQELVALD